MSTVKANNHQIGQSGTATNNFTLYQPSTPDGTVRLAVGNSGATSADVLTANSSGNVGIGTSSPGEKLTVAATANNAGRFTSTATTTALVLDNTNANGWGSNIAINTGGVAAGYFGTIGSLLGNTTQDLAVYATAGNGFRVYTNGNNLRATLDSSGNLGLGVTPSAWNTSWKAIQIGSNSALASQGSVTDLQYNAYRNTSNSDTYISSDFATRYRQISGTHTWSTAAAGTANTTTITSGVSYTIITSGNQTSFGAANNNVGTVFTATSSGTLSSGTVSQNITFTQAMTLDASGRLLVKTTSNTGTNTKLAIGSGLSSGNAVAYISTEDINVDGITISNWTGSATTNRVSLAFDSSTFGGFRIGMPGGVNAFQIYDTSAGAERARITSGGDFRVKGAGTAGSTDAFQVSGSAPADAARIDSSGNLLVGSTSTSGSSSNTKQIVGGNFRTFFNGPVTVGASATATILTLSSSVTGVYIVNANFGAQGNEIYGGMAIIVANAGSFRVVTNGGGTRSAISLSGANVQITNALGVTLDATATAIFIGN